MQCRSHAMKTISARCFITYYSLIVTYYVLCSIMFLIKVSCLGMMVENRAMSHYTSINISRVPFYTPKMTNVLIIVPT